MRCMLAEVGGRRVLFDTGVGPATVEGMGYYRFHGLKDLGAETTRSGFPPESITDVVLSHLHFDHCGGCVRRSPQGGLEPAFPNARYWASAGQGKVARNPSLWESDSFAPEVVQVLSDAGLMHWVESDGELFPGVRVALFQGHTDDQLVSYVGEGPETVVFCGDVIPMEPHIVPLCIAAVDNSAVVSVEEKVRLLKASGEAGHIFFFYHDTETAAVRLKRTGDRVSVKEKWFFH